MWEQDMFLNLKDPFCTQPKEDGQAQDLVTYDIS